MSIVNLGEVENFYLTIVLNSKTNCLKKSPNNWAWNTRFTNLPTGPSAMARQKVSTNTLKVVLLNT